MLYEEYRTLSSKRGWKFKVILEEHFDNIQFIHPLKQKEVAEIIKVSSQFSFIKSIKIFGSAITDECTINSDLDLCVDCNESCIDEDGVFTLEANRFIKLVRSICKNGCDIGFVELLKDSYIEKDALGGVLVYVQDGEKK